MLQRLKISLRGCKSACVYRVCVYRNVHSYKTAHIVTIYELKLEACLSVPAVACRRHHDRIYYLIAQFQLNATSLALAGLKKQIQLLAVYLQTFPLYPFRPVVLHNETSLWSFYPLGES